MIHILSKVDLIYLFSDIFSFNKDYEFKTYK